MVAMVLVSHRPNQVAWKLRVVKGIAIHISTAPKGRIVTWRHEWHHPLCGSPIAHIPKLICDSLGTLRIVPPWATQVYHNEVETAHFIDMLDIILEDLHATRRRKVGSIQATVCREHLYELGISR